MSRFDTTTLIAVFALMLLGCGDGFDSAATLTSQNIIPTTGNQGQVAACPAGVICVTEGWRDAQQTISLPSSTIWSMKIQTTDAGVHGKVQTAYTTGNSGNREIALSTEPGNFNVPKECYARGTQTTSNFWHQGPGGEIYQCELPVNGIAYLNIRHTNCTELMCEFYLAF